jgi:hypothetical protein
MGRKSFLESKGREIFDLINLLELSGYHSQMFGVIYELDTGTWTLSIVHSALAEKASNPSIYRDTEPQAVFFCTIVERLGWGKVVISKAFPFFQRINHTIHVWKLLGQVSWIPCRELFAVAMEYGFEDWAIQGAQRCREAIQRVNIELANRLRDPRCMQDPWRMLEVIRSILAIKGGI